MDKIRFGFVGAGNMGSAIIKGIVRGMGDKAEIFVFDPDTAKTDALKELGVNVVSSGAEAAEKSRYLFLAVKPQMFEDVLGGLAGHISENNVIVSIAAGITEEYICSKTLPEAKVVLVMPNTPFLLGEGATALAKGKYTADDEFTQVCDVFGMGGRYAVVPNDRMKEIIAVNGSSPAFIYLFAKHFIDYAASVGIDAGAAKELFAQSLIGSAKMMTDSGYTIDELIKMVSSPGGTTLAGLDELYKGSFAEDVRKCCESCTRRAYELSK